MLGIVHTGHKFNSPLGIALVVAMLAVVFSGFAGHYFVVQLGTDLRSQQGMLAVLRTRYDAVARALMSGSSAALAAVDDMTLPGLLTGIVDLELSITEREALNRSLSRWVVLHIGAALVI